MASTAYEQLFIWRELTNYDWSSNDSATVCTMLTIFIPVVVFAVQYAVLFVMAAAEVTAAHDTPEKQEWNHLSN